MGWNKKKKLRCMIVLIFLIVLSMMGCKIDSNQSTEIGMEFCNDVSYFDCMEGKSFCDLGMVRIENGLIMFHEYDTGKVYPLCSDAYCKHEPYAVGKNPDPVCEATMKGLVRACVYKDYLYVLQEDGFQSLILKSRDLTQSGYKTVAKLPYTLAYSKAYNALRDNKLYLFGSDTDLEDGDELGHIYTSHDFNTYLLEVDIKTGAYQKLFEFDVEEKYQILNATYGKKGIFIQGYYEDVDFNQESLELTVNEYREVFYFVSYDGKEKKRLRPDVTEITEFGVGRMRKAVVNGITEDGIYVSHVDTGKFLCYSYDGMVSVVYEIPDEVINWDVSSISGTACVLFMIYSDGRESTVGIELNTRKMTSLSRDNWISFLGQIDGVFEIVQKKDQETYHEYWTYESLVSENDKAMLVTD